MPACRDIPYVLEKLSWMRAECIWPNGQRYTWTDAFGVVLFVSLYAELGKPHFLDEAEWVVSDVDRVLGRPRGIRIGEAPDRDGQYFHYLAMWLYALSVLARHVPAYRRKGAPEVRHCTPVRLSRAGCSRQLGRASAPMILHRVHAMRGPNVGTGTSSGHGAAFRTASRWHTLSLR